ncbi:MAG TPA: YihY/virulence factor BrkB family protein [Candidatus Latescibacteria bacterium]|jgi:membrane protein|nr:YihY/virulence factor BrkB family protein [Candidatus Latescibacterota bacterium]
MSDPTPGASGSSGNHPLSGKPESRIRDVLVQTVRGTYDHDCADAAAAMAFDFVFAVFPAIIVLTALLAVMDIPVEAFGALLHDFGVVVPGPLIDLIEDNLKHAAGTPQSFFALGIIGVIWPASASMSTTMSALNRAYGTSEERTVWLRRLLSVVLIISLGLSLVVLFNLIVFSEQFDLWLEHHWALSVEVPSLAGLLRHTAGVTGTLVAAAIIYRVAPDVRLGWLDVLPGSLLFLAQWTLIAGGFSYYVRNFSYYNVVYGVLGGVIIMLLSAYLVSFTLLLGGELNGVLYRSIPRHPDPEANR